MSRMSNYECPHCQPDDQCIWCRVEKLSHENEDLRAEVERLTRERDNARSLLDKSQDDERMMIKEQDRLKDKLRELRRKCGEWAPYVDHAGCPRVAAEMREEARNNDSLERAVITGKSANWHR